MFEYAIIMAAGKGERMKPLTNYVPKALAQYKGKALIYYVIDNLKQYIKHVYVTVGYKKELLLHDISEKGIAGFINTTGHDNAWWVYNSVMKYINKPIVVSACDLVWELLDFDKIYKEYDKNMPCMIIPVSAKSGIDGDFIFKENNIIKSLTRTKFARTYCSGVQIINPFLINKLTVPTDNWYAMWNQLIDKELLYCSNNSPENWLAFDTIEQLRNNK